MSTTIQWTDETWNPVTGCTRVSEGCRNCYIERTPPFRMGGRKLGDPVQLHHDRLEQPLHWKKPRRVFVNSLSDLFHEDVPDEFLEQVFSVMHRTPNHTYQILTKRPQRMRQWFTRSIESWTYSALPAAPSWPFSNVWLGVSVEDQKTADERIPMLLQTPAAVRWVSVEPLLGPVDLYRGGFTFLERLTSPSGTHYGKLDWVVVGGESGPRARPCDFPWIRSILGQCAEVAVPCFVKQLGSSQRITRDHKGGDPSEWPADLRVREWPR